MLKDILKPLLSKYSWKLTVWPKLKLQTVIYSHKNSKLEGWQVWTIIWRTKTSCNSIDVLLRSIKIRVKLLSEYGFMVEHSDGDKVVLYCMMGAF